MPPVKKSNPSKNPHDLQRGVTVPIYKNDVLIFNDEFARLRERFAFEMKKIAEEMTSFSHQLLQLTCDKKGSRDAIKDQRSDVVEDWNIVRQSPLVEVEGETKVLKLQFDVSQFDPDEVTAKICDNILYVSAVHEENSDDSTVYNEFQKEFVLPSNTNIETIRSSISKDGILIVKIPLVLGNHEQNYKDGEVSNQIKDCKC